MGMFYTHKAINVLQYHLECIDLEQAPTKWICKACEVSGPAKAPTEVMSYYYIRNCA